MSLKEASHQFVATGLEVLLKVVMGQKPGVIGVKPGDNLFKAGSRMLKMVQQFQFFCYHEARVLSGGYVDILILSYSETHLLQTLLSTNLLTWQYFSFVLKEPHPIPFLFAAPV